MSRPAASVPAEGGPLPAVCGHTHLFRGATVRVQGVADPAGFAARPRPLEVELVFSDGVVLTVELLVSDDGSAVLSVPAYTTEAGAGLPQRTWPVREFTVRDADVELLLDARLD
ncbi:hypothetical protein [Streptomyces triticirhizae]|uniref:Uncharacterized protein n=1 Tax=Streptomyces triticirhizae TaxID=2483353 RepID=A0A3M2LD49_9ACTN|nr:hypothetical protein [Streptomyces triticirhizae]RMI34523.1 hypothetical protein EBN88_23720 [Streptomyces triticirhizae]